MEMEHQNEGSDYPEPIFFKKKSLSEDTKQELQELKSYYEYEKRRIKDVWQATVDVVRGKYETNLKIKKAMLLAQNQGSKTSTSEDRDKREDDASGVQFNLQTSEEAAEFYKIWIEEFKKNSSRQKEAVRDLLEKRFDFLHRFDHEKPLSPTDCDQKDGVMITILHYWCIVASIVLCVLFIFQKYVLVKCDDEFLVCLNEIIITLAFEIRNIYFQCHGITLDYSSVSDIGYVSEVADVVSDSIETAEIISV